VAETIEFAALERVGGRLLSRYSPALDSRFSYRGEDVVTTLERVFADRLSEDDPCRSEFRVHLPRLEPYGRTNAI
jgi:hypothetical protein